MYPGNVTEAVAFNKCNTEDMTDEQIDMLNVALASYLRGHEVYSDDYFDAAWEFRKKVMDGA